MAFVFNPVFPLCDVGPGADIGQSARQSVNVAIGFVDPGNGLGQPVGGNTTAAKPAPHEKFVDPGQKGGVFLPAGRAEVGNPADIPQKLHPFGFGQAVLNLGKGGQGLERKHVIGVAGAGQPVVRGGRFKAADQPVGGAEIHLLVAPVQFLDRSKAVVFDGFDKVFVKGARFAGDAKGAVFGVTPGAAGNLGQFLCMQRAHPAAIELGGRGKGSVFDVKVETHADRIRGDEVIHVAILIERHLRVSCAR